MIVRLYVPHAPLARHPEDKTWSSNLSLQVHGVDAGVARVQLSKSIRSGLTEVHQA